MQNYPASYPRFDTATTDDVDAACNPGYGISAQFTRSELQTCLDLCRRCQEVCLQLSVTQCSWRGRTDLEPEQLRLMTDCAQACQTTADFIARNSPYHIYFCSLCGSICEACAESCELLGGLDACAHLCRLCAASCLSVAE